MTARDGQHLRGLHEAFGTFGEFIEIGHDKPLGKDLGTYLQNTRGVAIYPAGGLGGIIGG